jgi:cytochrome c oxidase accessory protein FixG
MATGIHIKPGGQGSGDFRSVLASVDSRGRRRWIYVAPADGFWRRQRTAWSCLLIALYLAIPFVRIGGEPALRIDIAARRLHLLGGVFEPSDLAALALLAVIAITLTVLAVALFGRVFCGWICPHNVFLETVFRRIEMWCEGGAPQRKRRDEAPMGVEKFARKSAKWLLFIAAGGAIANAFTAVFVGTEAFIGGVFIDAVHHPNAAFVFTLLFVLVLFNFGWFREQTCTIVCPYGRLQSALTDADSVGVIYDAKRGEPRGKPGKTVGACVDCHRCVHACPTGIDIRNGNQLECLHCTACIDACDAVMVKLGRDPGLIRYASESQLAGKARRLLRPRTVLTAALLAALTGGLALLLWARTEIDVMRLRDTALPSVDHDAQGREVVRGLINLAIKSRDGRSRTLSFSVADGRAQVVSQYPTLSLRAHARAEQSLIVLFPRAMGALDSQIQVCEQDRVVASVPISIGAR